MFLMTLPKISRSVPAPRMRSLLLVLALAPCAAIKVGDKLPSVDLDWGFPPDKVPMGTWTDGKTSVIVGLPGAFTPTWCAPLPLLHHAPSMTAADFPCSSARCHQIDAAGAGLR